MTATILQSELASLLQDAKRKHPDVRAAVEKSISELKSLSITSETQLSGDLLRKPSFIEPFILASKTQNGKLAPSSVVCLQRLVAGGAIPRERLRDVLEAFREFSSAGLDPQLKILQSLPAILQTYRGDIHGDSLFVTLQICGILVSHKAAVIANTSAATFQQLVSTVFEEVAAEDDDSNAVRDVEIHLDDKVLFVGSRASDAYKVLDDLCVMLEGGRSANIGLKSLPPAFILETLESIVTNAGRAFRRHEELVFALRRRAISATLALLSAKQPFNVCVRAARLLSLLIRNHLDALEEDGEMILNLFIYLLEPDSGPFWKRILSMEVFKSIFADLRLVRLIYTKFDAIEGRKDILRDLMGVLVRIASEKPALTGLSHQSTVPRKRGITPDANDEQASIEAMGVAGIVGSAVAAEANVTGISVQWSVPKIPCIDQLDKSEPAPLPDTYIFSLLLGLLGSFSDAMTRFIMPLSVPRENRGRNTQVQQSLETQESEDGDAAAPQRTDSDASTKRKQIVLLNPLTLNSHPQLDNIKAVAAIITTCWPAFLATSSIFLYAALDAEHYHGLIRALQKFTQVSGVLRLDTPRDALLTSLGKAAVPADAIDRIPLNPSAEIENENEKQLGTDNSPPQSPTVEKGSLDDPPATLNTRNLLCLRALVNLGIALGPTMDVNAWSIVLSTLQQSELVIKFSIEMRRHRTILPNGNADSEDILRTNLGGEIVAVQSATKKLFTSTTDYPSDSFQVFLNALCGSVSEHDSSSIPEKSPTPITGPNLSVPSKKPTRGHRPQRSISLTIATNRFPNEQYFFLLDKLPVLLAANKARLATEDPQKSGWSIMSSTLLIFIHDTSRDSVVRLRSIDLLNQLAIEALVASSTEEARSKAEIQKRALSLLQSELGRITNHSIHARDPIIGQLHERVLTALETVLQTSGDDIIAGWSIVFAIINSVFRTELNATRTDETGLFNPRSLGTPIELVRVSFRSLQLLGSDYLDRLPSPCLLAYVVALHDFGAQTEDLNIALTGTTSFWSLIEFLREHMSGPPRAVKDALLAEQAASKEVGIASNALWIIAMRHLAEIALDERDDVRNTAGKLLLRIFEIHSSSMSAEMWYNCTQTIFMRLLNAQVSDESKKTGPWISSSISLLEGFVKLLVNDVDVLSKAPVVQKILNEMLETCAQLLKLDHLLMDRCVFESASTLVNTLAAHDLVTQEVFRKTWTLWVYHGKDLSNADSDSRQVITLESNRAALISYTECLLALCQLPNRFQEIVDTGIAVGILEKVVFCSRHPMYTTDVIQASAEQEKVLQLLELLSSRLGSRPDQYISTLVKLIKGSRPEAKVSEKGSQGKPSSKLPSLVALSKGAIRLLDSAYTQQPPTTDNISESVTLEALQCLRDTIACTDARDLTGEPPLWRVATSAACSIVQRLVNVALVPTAKRALELDPLAKIVNAINAAILQASVNDMSSSKVGSSVQRPTSITDDEEFDISAFESLQLAMLPLLSSTEVSNDSRREYMNVLFRKSLMFEGFPEDLPEDLVREPLSNLYQIRNGYVDLPQLVPRQKIAYVALDALFSLVAGKDIVSSNPTPSLPTGLPNLSSSRDFNHHPLAIAAAPYLILRSALPLKTFIADQPLRGLMPIPAVVTREIVYIVIRYINLDSLSDCVPPLPRKQPHASVASPNKSHLPHLHPLVLEFWSILKRLPNDDNKRTGINDRHDDDDNDNNNGAAAAKTQQQRLADAVEKWMREAAPFTAQAVGIEVKREEWWR